MTLNAPYLVGKFGVKMPESLVVHIVNQPAAFHTANGAIVLDLPDLGGAGADIEITRSGPATPSRAAR
jgi:hypothetical protein